jgi:tRNA threonylcarbamoyladenosine modification (KEOPS) complex  Pcc1 subunit
LRQVFGTVANAATKLQRVPMKSKLTNCKAQIEISFKSINQSESGLLAKSILAAIAADTKAYETIITNISGYDTNSNISLELVSSEIPELRAAINSYLRLINASLKICEMTMTNNSQTVVNVNSAQSFK